MSSPTCSRRAPRPDGCPRNPLTLCLITDRARLVDRLSASPKAWQPLLLDQIRGAIAGGVDVVQLRERGLEGREYAAFIRDCLALGRGTAARFVVNDRLDLALATEAHGVHLREDSVSIDTARSIAPPDFLIGRSVHDGATAALARNADYLIVGNVFATESKPGRAALEARGLREVVDRAAGCPVWAIGGITADRIRDVAAAGASGIAAIGAFLPPPGAADVARSVQDQTAALREAMTT